MAIAFVDSNTTVNAISGTSHTLTLPSFSPGDVIVAACAVNNSLSGLTLPSGWQRLSGAAPLTMVVVMRVMQSGDAGTITFTTDVPRTSTLVGLSFSGVDSTHPLDASGGMVSVAGLNAAALLHPGVTTLTTNAMQVYFLGQHSLAPTWATPTGATEVEDSGGVAAGYQARASAGATGTITSQPSAFNTSADYVSFVMALRESGASQGASPVVMPPIFADASDTTLGTNIKQWTKNATGTTWSSGVPGGNVYSVSDPVRTATPSGNAESGMGLGPGLNLAEQIDVDLEATPVDFASMASLSIRYSTVSIGPYGDDTGRWAILILNAAGTTCLAGFSNGTAVATDGLVCDRFDGANWSSTTQGATGTAPAYNKTNAFDFVNTAATKADWDGAFARLYFLDSRNMGSDSASIVLVEFQLEGTYTKSGANIETLDSTSTVTTEATNVAHRVEIISDVITETGSMSDVVAAIEVLDTSISATTAFTESTADSEIGDTAITATVATVETLHWNDILDLAASITVDLLDFVAATEAPDSTAIVTTGVDDAAVHVESGDSVITASTEIVDLQDSQEVLDASITASSEILESGDNDEILDVSISLTSEALNVQASFEALDTTVTDVTESLATIRAVESLEPAISASTEVSIGGSEVLDTTITAEIATDAPLSIDFRAETTISGTTTAPNSLQAAEGLDTTIAVTSDALDAGGDSELAASDFSVTTEISDVARRTELLDETLIATSEVSDDLGIPPEVLDVQLVVTSDVSDSATLPGELLDVVISGSSSVLEATDGAQILESSISMTTEIDDVQSNFEVFDDLGAVTTELTDKIRLSVTLDSLSTIESTTYGQVLRVDLVDTTSTATTEIDDPQSSIDDLDTLINFVSDASEGGEGFESLTDLITFTSQVLEYARITEIVETTISTTADHTELIDQSIDFDTTGVVTTDLLELGSFYDLNLDSTLTATSSLVEIYQSAVRLGEVWGVALDMNPV